MGEVVMRAPKLLCGALLVAVVVFGLPSVVNAAAFIVSNTNDSGPGSLRRAINRANNNTGADTIFFVSGGSGKIILTSGQLLIRDDLTISGPGASVLAVSGNHSSRVFEIESGATVAISGLTITEGLIPPQIEEGGAGVRNFGSLSITDSAITANRTTALDNSSGGGIQNNGSLTVTNSVISENFADRFGGGIGSSGGGLHDTSVTLINTRVIGNFADEGGAGIQNSGSPLVIRKSTIRDNFEPDSGTSILSGRAPVTITGSTISRNRGGGIDPRNSIQIFDGSALIANSRVVGNSVSGIGFDAFSSSVHSLVVSNSVIRGNSGGGIFNDSASVILRNNTRVINNSGPGVVNAVANQLAPATLTVRSSTVSANTHEGNGGGIFNEATETVAGTVRLVSATVNANTAESGGGVYNQGILALTSGSTITMNTATGGLGSGGGVFIDGGSVTLDASSSVTGNTPDDFAGG
jgi:hypothetical protein